MSYYNIRETLNENNLFKITHISLCSQIGTATLKEKEIGQLLAFICRLTDNMDVRDIGTDVRFVTQIPRLIAMNAMIFKMMNKF